MNITSVLRTLFSLVVGLFVLWLIFTVSFFVILPILVVLALVGAFFYWRYGKMFTSATVGEVGQAMQDIAQGEKGLVRFNREMQAGGQSYHTNVNLSCKALSLIAAGEMVCVEAVNNNEITIKRMGQ